ncbi:hypothetical protein [Azospirillum sp. TSO5]|uniref:hypothetical protein n=1 Tax=Azospirillum sp. TSO5 TaxID=716760 RepID=UPI000D6180DA|nr:hypothetical protein [Azospirillum sp. TSO5]PWC96932.1 hypothetical protein TSO5_05740 [Azospirillum sp. TSO5]
MMLAPHTLPVMTDAKPFRTTLIMSPELLERVNRFRFDKRFENRNDAILALLDFALDNWRDEPATQKQ